MIYPVVFFVASFFAYEASKTKKKEWIYIYSAISILLPAILGGLRSTTLGTDVQVYLISHFNFAHSISSLKGYLTTYNTMTGREPLYRVLVYCVAQFTDNINVLMFVFQLLTILFVYIGAYKHRDQVSLSLVMLLYFFLFYNDSYNLIRQYLAMAIVFANIDKLEKKKYKNFLIWIVIATLVHTTAFIGIGLIVIHYFIANGKVRDKLIKKVALMAGVIVGGLFFGNILTLAVKLGLLSERYLFYIENEGVSGNNLASILYLIEIVVCLIYSGVIRRKLKDADFYMMNLFVLFSLLQLSRVIYYGNRISMIFMFPNLLLLGFLPRVAKNGKSKLLASSIICMAGFVYWGYIFVYGNASQTYPYVLGV